MRMVAAIARVKVVELEPNCVEHAYISNLGKSWALSSEGMIFEPIPVHLSSPPYTLLVQHLDVPHHHVKRSVEPEEDRSDLLSRTRGESTLPNHNRHPCFLLVRRGSAVSWP